MAIVLLYECPHCKKTIQELHAIVKRHDPCPSSQNPEYYKLKEVKVD